MSILEITSENTDTFENIIKGTKPVVAEFSAPWCVYCRRLEPALERTAEKLKNIDFVHINIDELPNIAQKYKIHSIPALILFKDNTHGDTLIGPPSQDAVEEWINKQL